ncbi:MAG: alkaline phosphatase family protein [Actinomycetota bacterium]|nr:alkaline phosphatase family protein [Actinomycetota bacterium]
MRWSSFAVLLVVCCSGAAPAAERPRLIVQMTFDQLRGDLLQRYNPAFTGGFRRVLDQGWWVRNGEAAHGITVSFPGHGTLATGLFPSHHGFTANEWWLQVGSEWRPVSVAGDPTVRIVGRESTGGQSPRHFEGRSIGDWVKSASPGAKSIAIGSDAAIVYGGRKPDGVYWFDAAAGGFTTSTYYASERPDWVEQLNARMAALPREWTFKVPERWRSLADHPNQCPPMQPLEVFPHRFNPSSGSALSWVTSTPLVDEELLRQVGNIVRAEQLGNDSTPDYLAIAVSSTDSVGHDYGPVSEEQLDTLLRLDASLGVMLDDLDRIVGKGRYIVAISADHGSVDPPEQRCVHRVTTPEIEAVLDRVEAIAKAHTGSQAELTAKIVTELKRAPFIGDVYTESILASAPESDWKAQLMKRSFRPGRITDFPLWTNKPRPHHPARYGIFVQFKEGLIFDNARSVHGSPYAYDRLVPVIFYGAGVPKRQLSEGGRTVDVAPTLAALAGIPLPENLDGRPLIADP